MRTIETERLHLRPWRREDVEDLYAYAKNPNVGPNAGWKPHESLQESQDILQGWLNEDETKSCTWAIVPKETGHVSGSIALEEDGRRLHVPGCRSMGYVLAQEAWGKGYMTEAAQAVLSYGFQEMGLSLIAIDHYPHNQRSRRVIEKCGFHYEGLLRQGALLYDGTRQDLCCYSMTAEEFQSLQAI